MFYAYYNSPVGKLLLECNDMALTGLWIENQKYYATGADDNIQISNDHPILVRTCQWLNEYFAGGRPNAVDIPLAPRGTDFQRHVWHALRQIPYGETVTYGDIARHIGSSPRAVGGAIGRNPISIIIPCHRVLGTGGAITGYAGGTVLKQKLLTHEHANLSTISL